MMLRVLWVAIQREQVVPVPVLALALALAGDGFVALLDLVARCWWWVVVRYQLAYPCQGMTRLA